MKKSFLVQLAWADLLSDEELSELLNEYEREVEIQLLMETEKLRRGSIARGELFPGYPQYILDK